MSLHVDRPSFSMAGALLLPLLSSMLLWKNVASLPMCEVINGHCQLTLEYLLNQARGISEDINRLTLEMFNEFVSISLTSGFSQEELSQQYLGGTTAQWRSTVIWISYNTPSQAQEPSATEAEPEEWKFGEIFKFKEEKVFKWFFSKKNLYF